MGPKQCQVCNEAQSKYKCPSCLIPYCSLGCFKKHKDIPCSKPVPTEENSVATDTKIPGVKLPSSDEKSAAADAKIPCVKPESSKESLVAADTKIICAQSSSKDKFTTGVESYRERRPYYANKASELLQNSQLESVVSSREIRDALKNEDLQKLISNIDSSPEAENELDKAMENEGFRLFADKILSIISPSEP